MKHSLNTFFEVANINLSLGFETTAFIWYPNQPKQELHLRQTVI